MARTPDKIQLGCSTSLSNLKAFAFLAFSETFMEDRFEAAGLGPSAQEEARPKTGAEDGTKSFDSIKTNGSWKCSGQRQLWRDRGKLQLLKVCLGPALSPSRAKVELRPCINNKRNQTYNASSVRKGMAVAPFPTAAPWSRCIPSHQAPTAASFPGFG